MSQFSQAISELINQVIHSKAQPIRLVQPIEQDLDIDAIDWLEGQPHFPKFYWHSRNSREEVVALGQLARFSEPAVAYDSLHEGQRIWGGLPFESAAKDNELPQESSAFFFLPQIELSRFDDNWSLSVNVADNKTETIAALNRLAMDAKTLPPVSASVTAIEHQPGQALWHQKVNDALGSIEADHFKKVVLARKSAIKTDMPVSAAQLLKASKVENRHCFHFLFATDKSQAFIGSTPERLYRRHGQQLETEALAGTIGRGENEQQDIELADWLVQDTKNLAENQYVVDDIVERLTPYVDHVEFQQQAELVQLRKVQHLKRAIGAKLKPGVSAAQLLAALQPTAAVAGLPREKAIEYIQDNEGFCRGWYSGSLGYISHQKAEFCVAIRSALVRDDKMYLFTGAGIVKGSESDVEWLELERKMSTLLFLFKESDLFQKNTLFPGSGLLQKKERLKQAKLCHHTSSSGGTL